MLDQNSRPHVTHCYCRMVFRDGGFDTSWTVFAFKGSICNAAQTHEHGTDFIGELMSEKTIAANTPSFSAVRAVQEQGATITRQRKDFETAIAQQQKQIEALTAAVKQ
ncbi:MAG: hypothetical protein C5B58_07660 [Acidobacteria bacterium]|nr:MAG: hypothetical protein C5B58_07660 [Acidobacteriota bacterium]